MNFDDAIRSHWSWKTRLARYLDKPDRSIDPASLEADDLCALGQWIHGEGRISHWSEKLFHQLKSEHARFHKEAAALARRADSGERVDGLVALGVDSAYSRQSALVIKLIQELKRKVTSEEAA